MSLRNPTDDYVTQLRQEAQIYSNIVFVLDKLEAEGNLKNFSALTERVIGQEVVFAFHELHRLSNGGPNFDVNSQLIRNTVIFKENLKLILNSLGGLTSRHSVDGKNSRIHKLRSSEFS